MLPTVTFWNSLKATLSSIVTLPIYNYRILPNSLSQIQKNKFSMATPVLENLDFTWKKKLKNLEDSPGKPHIKFPQQILPPHRPIWNLSLPLPHTSTLSKMLIWSDHSTLAKNSTQTRKVPLMGSKIGWSGSQRCQNIIIYLSIWFEDDFRHILT